jgi:cytochrome P450
MRDIPPTDDLSIDFGDPAVLVDPFPHYERLQHECPMYWDEAEAAWLITRYEHVLAALEDPRLSAQTDMSFMDELPEPMRTQTAPLRSHFESWMLFNDAPVHTRLRSILGPALSRQAIAGARTKVTEAADRILDAAEESGVVEAVRGYGVPLAHTLLADVMGLEHGRLGKAVEWADELLTFINIDLNPDQTAKANRCLAEMTDFVRDLRDVEHVRPGSIASALASSLADGTLSETEAVAIVSQVYTGTLGPVPLLLGNAFLALANQPSAFRQLRADPSQTVQAVEEFLRHDPPFLQVPRTAAAELELGGTCIKAGDRVGLMLAAANRDGAQWSSPDRLDFDRTPNRHVAFGVGTHYCLGAPMTRMVATVAVSAVVSRYSEIELVDEVVERRPLFGMRGPESLSLRLKK